MNTTITKIRISTKPLTEWERNLKNTLEQSMLHKYGLMFSICEDYETIRSLRLYREDCETFEEYTKIWGMNEDQLNGVLAIHSIYEDTHDILKPGYIAENSIANHFVHLNREQRRLLAHEVAKSSEPVTEDLLERIKSGLFPSPENAIGADCSHHIRVR